MCSFMKYIDEFRNKDLIKKLAEKIKAAAPPEKVNIMEVCGTHTQNFFRFGLDKLLPQQLNLISGPGCPVCVSSQEYIDKAILYAKDKHTIILTFGDMLRVPGTKSTLEEERAQGADVRVAYSSLDAISIARQNPHKRIIFLAVGFETTAPTVALSIIHAKQKKLSNLFFFSALKLIPPVMACLLKDKRLNLSGFLCPGHVSAIIGSQPYDFIPKHFGIGCCVTGFEPVDILEGIYFLLEQILKKRPSVANQYKRVVTRQGNLEAKKIIYRVFKSGDASWRGLGRIPKSGLRMREGYLKFDAECAFPLKIKQTVRNTQYARQCRCPDVLKGLIKPSACALFIKACSPEHPVGPCMISIEGACNAYYKYQR